MSRTSCSCPKRWKWGSRCRLISGWILSARISCGRCLVVATVGCVTDDAMLRVADPTPPRVGAATVTTLMGAPPATEASCLATVLGPYGLGSLRVGWVTAFELGG
jgi:hypothetical protein